MPPDSAVRQLALAHQAGCFGFDQVPMSITWGSFYVSRFPMSWRGMLVALLATAFRAGGVVAAWVIIGPTGLAFAWITHFLLMGWV